jgi:hypothetical protein
MNHTIRDYLKRRVWRCMAVGIGGWLLVATSMGSHIDHPIISILGVLMFAGAILALQLMTKCPRCSARLGQIAMGLGVPWLKPQANFCPYCGVSLDEPINKTMSPTGPQPYNPIRRSCPTLRWRAHAAGMLA